MDGSGEHDVEMHPLTKNLEDFQTEKLLQTKKGVFTGLTKQELLEVEKNETFWKKLRIALFVSFWVIWFGMLISAIIIIIVTPKCPKQETLGPWEKTCIYRLNPFAFKDSNGDGTGDLKGLEDKLSYISDDLGLETIIIDPISKGDFDGNDLHLTSSFNQLHPDFGSMEDFILFVKSVRKKGITVIATLDINGVGHHHDWFQNKKNYFFKENKATNKTCEFSGIHYYTSFKDVDEQCRYLDLNTSNADVIAEMKNITKFWLTDVGVGGILFTNGAFLDKTSNDSLVFDYLKQIRSVFDDVNKVTSKKKVFMLEAGDVTGSRNSKSLTDYSFSDEGKKLPLVDVVLMSDFLSNNVKQGLNMPNIISSYSKTNRTVALSTGSPYVRRHSNLKALVSSYLLPGLTITYMGSELNLVGDENPTLDINTSFPYYPKKARSVPTGADILQCAMLPWTVGGVPLLSGTTEAKIMEYNKVFGTANSSVELLSAIGAPLNILTLTKKLIQIKKNQSFLWGNVTLVENSKDNLLFTREAPGYNKFIVLYTSNDKATAVSLSSKTSKCDSGNVRLSYPKSNLPEDKEIQLASVYIEAGERVTVVECNTP